MIKERLRAHRDANKRFPEVREAYEEVPRELLYLHLPLWRGSENAASYQHLVARILAKKISKAYDCQAKGVLIPGTFITDLEGSTATTDETEATLLIRRGRLAA